MEHISDKTVVIGNLRHDIIRRCQEKRHFVITDSVVYKLYPQLFEHSLPFVIPSGETSKNIDIVQQAVLDMLHKGHNRNSVVVGVGGGVVTDVAGFVAGVFMRGVEWVLIPTTLLGQVDASIGGKTGVNVGGYKNMIGVFHKPIEVLCDVTMLASLDENNWRSGVGEIVKTALINKELWHYLHDNLQELLERHGDTVQKIVQKCIAIKSNIVSLDFLDRGMRQILNLGHTLGHAIESVDNYTLTHGEYVLIGIYLECLIFVQHCNQEYINSIFALLKRIIVRIPSFDYAEIVKAATKDKKSDGDDVAFVIPTQIGKVEHFKLDKKELYNRLKNIKFVL